MDESHNHSVNIAILPNPGAGHLIPILEFTRRLLLLHPSLHFTFLIIPTTSDDSSAKTTPSALSALPTTAYDVITLPAPSFPAFSDLVDESVNRVLRSVHLSLPALRQNLLQMTRLRRVAALVIDIFGTDAADVATELGIKSYIFYTASAIALSLFLHLPELHETAKSSDEGWDPQRPLKLPGCPVIQVKDLPEPLLDPNIDYFNWFVDHTKRYKSVEGIILNSFDALEGGPIRALVGATPPVYPVGPLVRTGLERNDDSDDPSGCLRWLDEQPPRSVLYVSFGSGGTLSTEQVTELAMGLELSKQRFVWVVRSPNDSCSYGTYLSLEEEHDALGFLPKGFVERTRGRGLVVKSWAPQVQVLSHGSTGGFLTHCGWNSILEGVVNGVGFIAWPLYAEQSMNAIELIVEAKVAVGARKGKDGVVGHDDIARAVKSLMEGEEGMEIKERMKTLKDEARRAVGKDGPSNSILSELVVKWKSV